MPSANRDRGDYLPATQAKALQFGSPLERQDMFWISADVLERANDRPRKGVAFCKVSRSTLYSWMDAGQSCRDPRHRHRCVQHGSGRQDQPLHRGTYYTLTAPAEAIVCRRGSLVAVSHDMISRHGGTARVAAFWLNDDDMVVALDLDNAVPQISQPSWPAITSLGAVGDMSLIGASSAALIRREGAQATIHRITGAESGTRITFTTPIPRTGIVDGILVAVGLHGEETLRCKVYNIEPREDLKATLTLVDEAPEVHRHG